MGSSGSDVTGAAGPRPRIGLTTYRSDAQWGVWHTEAAILPANYLDLVWTAGGLPVLLPPAPAAAEQAVAGIHGLVLSGGADVAPERYDASRHVRTGPAEPARDGWELAVLDAALASGTPVLGVCRGVQVLNIARGGTLHQHLPEVAGHEEHRPAPATFGRTAVVTTAGSRLQELVGEETHVACYHHQALDRLGEGVRAVAHAADGTVEAVELDGPAFALGVQWHPEQDLDDLRIVRALVAAARERMDQPRVHDRYEGGTDGGGLDER